MSKEARRERIGDYVIDHATAKSARVGQSSSAKTPFIVAAIVFGGGLAGTAAVTQSAHSEPTVQTDMQP